ncbi:hypothetical protein BUALT_Bualt08G0005600 [Buddleja alternifolia]|uniref:Retrotransposon Copia-like N-terminal domain-containing protein n=1 Tax=Buddleja alternifolia TaxID=168488 RepID=A0AAV6X2P3_9LAMI|nr:hypothetical protein BUALT_Bualt08G0005600 [Buddleja alternifolia]
MAFWKWRMLLTRLAAKVDVSPISPRMLPPPSPRVHGDNEKTKKGKRAWKTAEGEVKSDLRKYRSVIDVEYENDDGDKDVGDDEGEQDVHNDEGKKDMESDDGRSSEFEEPALSTTIESSPSATTTPNPQPPLTTLFPNPLTQIHHFLSIKLTSKNYLLWKTQILPLNKGLRLVSHIDIASSPPPSHHLHPDSHTFVPNPVFSHWEQQDNLLMSALLNFLTEEVIPLVVGASTSQAIWRTVERAFVSPSQARIMQLRLKLQNIKQGDSSIQSNL